MNKEEVKLQARLLSLFASFHRNTGKLVFIFFASQIPQLLEQNLSRKLSCLTSGQGRGFNESASKGQFGHHSPEKRMLWTSVAVRTASLHCHSFAIFLFNPMKKRVSSFEQKDHEAADAFQPCWR